ncbi:Translation initiation factor IF-1 [bioreactor metagenome]|uniref:Translation initiation factor IF-1 n=1 Tax=bioreactor metagenome TaxID=1076179 RepID=A0A644T5U8_9ZZZZ|nr:translation initiation factor IF-1 [Candidatus Elulimicrobiales bacterium]
MNNKENKDIEEFEDDELEIKEGRVIEALPAALFRVKFDKDGKESICFLKGKIKVFKIKILVGDKVLVEMDPYGGRGRIIRRL